MGGEKREVRERKSDIGERESRGESVCACMRERERERERKRDRYREKWSLSVFLCERGVVHFCL